MIDGSRTRSRSILIAALSASRKAPVDSEELLAAAAERGVRVEDLADFVHEEVEQPLANRKPLLAGRCRMRQDSTSCFEFNCSAFHPVFPSFNYL